MGFSVQLHIVKNQQLVPGWAQGLIENLEERKMDLQLQLRVGTLQKGSRLDVGLSFPVPKAAMGMGFQHAAVPPSQAGEIAVTVMQEGSVWVNGVCSEGAAGEGSSNRALGNSQAPVS